MYEQLPRFVREPDPSIYINGRALTLDFETTNLEHGTALEPRNQLLLACWSFNGKMKSHWGDEFSQHELLADIANADFIVAHNLRFELGWLKRCGLDLKKQLGFCSLIGEKVRHGNTKVPLSLSATAARRGLGEKDATASALIKAGVCPSTIPRDMLEEYCRQDVSLTEQIFLQQRSELQELDLLPVAYCRNLVTPVLADIEFNGMAMAPERVHDTWNEYSQKYASLEAQFLLFTNGVNFKSPKQMGEYLYGEPPAGLGFAELTDRKGNPIRSSSGGRKTDKHTIAALVPITDKQREFRSLASELAKLKVPVQNLKKMMAIINENPNDPRIFATFNQTTTDTDRLSSTARKGGFNFQNLDRAFKKLFRARTPSRVMCEVDGAGLEFRVAAHLGRDRQAKEDVVSGMDIHAATARTLGVSRQEAKSRTFRPLYGGKSGTVRERKYNDYFTSRYAGINRTQTRWTMEAAATKRVVTEWGSRFYFPDAEIQSSGYVKRTTQIFNYPIQQLATAEIIPLCLVMLWHLADEDQVMLVNTIHDSVVAEVEKVDYSLDKYYKLAHNVFCNYIYVLLERLYGIKFTMPLGCGIKTAEFWSDTKDELKFEPDDSSIAEM